MTRAFTPPDDPRARREDVAFWAPHLAELLERHGLAEPGAAPVSGGWSTFPVFLCGDVVVKLFGGTGAWPRSFAAERDALLRVAADPAIGAPALLAEGRLAERAEEAWPYLVTTRVPGVPWRGADLTGAQVERLAGELGERIARVHALPTDGAPADEGWGDLDVAAAAARSSLPDHLVSQVEAFVARLGDPDRAFLHGDVTGAHAFVEGGRLCGLIDWGDAVVADRHYELIQIQRDVFDCDAGLLRAFLEASAWPVGPDFAERALGFGLWRQAVGLAEHHTMDVFEPVAAKLDLAEIATLEELATALFEA